jgi:hypothetical protein
MYSPGQEETKLQAILMDKTITQGEMTMNGKEKLQFRTEFSNRREILAMLEEFIEIKATDEISILRQMLTESDKRMNYLKEGPARRKKAKELKSKDVKAVHVVDYQRVIVVSPKVYKADKYGNVVFL